MTCKKTGKVIHLDEGAAWAHICSLRKSGEYTKDYSPYRCGKHWHVGHSTVKLSKRIKTALRRKP